MQLIIEFIIPTLGNVIFLIQLSIPIYIHVSLLIEAFTKYFLLHDRFEYL